MSTTITIDEKLNKIDRRFLRNARRTAVKYNKSNEFIQFFVMIGLYIYYAVFRWIAKTFTRIVNNKYSKFFIAIPITVVIICILSTKIYGFYDSFGEKDFGRKKYYTQYEVKSGDTIWDIASDMVKINPEYNSTRAYAAEIMQINNCGKNIQSGCTLILPYYSTTEEQSAIIMKYITKSID